MNKNNVPKYGNSFTYNMMTMIFITSPKSIAYVSDFQNWNEHEEEMIDELLIKAKELEARPVLLIATKGDFTNGLYSKENIEELAHRKSEELQIIFYIMNPMIERGEPANIAKNLQTMMGLEYILVNENYFDPNSKVFTTDFFKSQWNEKALLVGNYVTKPENKKLRTLISEGEFEMFEDETGIKYRSVGRVKEGKKLGRTIGYPTANLPMSTESPLSHGVYAVKVQINQVEEIFNGMACYWTNETNENIVEVNILDFDQDIYGRRLELEWVQKLRNNKKVSDLDELKKLISQDEENVRDLFAE
jgi:riboflavin kinase/FMN adenylyltransferase